MQWRFENTWVLASVPLVFLLAWVLWKKGKRAGAVSSQHIVLTCTAIALALTGLSRPQHGKSQALKTASHSQVYLAFDISQSMLVQDLGANTRLDFAIHFVQRILSLLPSTQWAVFPFAADGYMALPPSLDSSAVEDFVRSVHPNFVTQQGTDLNQALQTLSSELERRRRATDGEVPGQDSGPVQVVLLSDGESQQPVRDGTLAAYRRLHVPIFTVGVGTQTGGRVPLRFDPAQMPPPVSTPPISKMDPTFLREIAKQTGGLYFTARLEEAVPLVHQLQARGSFGKVTRTFRVDREYGPWLLLFAFLVAFLELGLFGNWQPALRTLPFWIAFSLSAHGGNREAVALYNEAVGKIQSDPRGAIEHFYESLQQEPDTVVRKKALYNLGNLLLKTGQLPQALESYQAAYDSQAKDADFNQHANQLISENLALAARKLEEATQAQAGASDKPGDNPGSKPGSKEGDRAGPTKNYQPQTFSENEKKSLYDLIAEGEQRILQRLQKKNPGRDATYRGKPW